MRTSQDRADRRLPSNQMVLVMLAVAAVLVAGCSSNEATTTTQTPTTTHATTTTTSTVAPTTSVAPATTTTSQVPTTTTTEPLSETVEFTGRTSCRETGGSWSGPALADDVPGTSAETAYDCVYTLSDERVSGTGPVTVSVDMSLNGDTRVGAISGTTVISNEGGTWEGTLSGTTTWTLSNQSHVHVLDAEYLGTGSYEGLRLVVHQEGIEFPWATTGRIEPVE